jgi:cytidylate kinase
LLQVGENYSKENILIINMMKNNTSQPDYDYSPYLIDKTNDDFLDQVNVVSKKKLTGINVKNINVNQRIFIYANQKILSDSIYISGEK